MDIAGVHPVDTTVEPAPTPGEPPPIGVPRIPAAAERAQPPSAVPSLAGAETDPLPDPDPAPAQLAPVPPVPAVPTPGRADVAGFPVGVADQLRAYVYLLIDPRTGRAFYVGRGRGDRCFRHLEAARSAPDADPDPDGPGSSKYPVLARIREAEASGREVRIDILRHGLKGSEAALVESAARDALGLQPDGAGPVQRRAAGELGARLAKRAKFKRTHQVVLLRVGGPGSDATYEVARHNWRIGRRWTDLDSPRSPQWAVLVVGELVAAVHRIDGWEPTPTAPGSSRSVDRFSFVGPADAELEQRYRHRSVAPYLGEGTPSQVTYVWCGPHWVNSPR